MKIFLSWSGERSREFAETLSNWLPLVIQTIDIYFSPDDIEKGSRWFREISSELEQTDVGIICLTNANLQAPWLLFEAGALSKSVAKSRVIPMLFGVDPSELQGPLVQFQATSNLESDVRKLLKQLNKQNEGHTLDPQRLDAIFDKFWPELEEKMDNIMSADYPERETESRSEKELLEEVLELSRAQFYRSYPESAGLINPILVQPIDWLEFSVLSSNELKAESLYYIGDLVQLTEKELLNIPNFGKKQLAEIEEGLARYHLYLGMKLDKWPPHFLKEYRHPVRSV